MMIAIQTLDFLVEHGHNKTTVAFGMENLNMHQYKGHILNLNSMEQSLDL